MRSVREIGVIRPPMAVSHTLYLASSRSTIPSSAHWGMYVLLRPACFAWQCIERSGHLLCFKCYYNSKIIAKAQIVLLLLIYPIEIYPIAINIPIEIVQQGWEKTTICPYWRDTSCGCLRLRPMKLWWVYGWKEVYNERGTWRMHGSPA